MFHVFGVDFYWSSMLLGAFLLVFPCPGMDFYWSPMFWGGFLLIPHVLGWVSIGFPCSGVDFYWFPMFWGGFPLISLVLAWVSMDLQWFGMDFHWVPVFLTDSCFFHVLGWISIGFPCSGMDFYWHSMVRDGFPLIFMFRDGFLLVSHVFGWVSVGCQGFFMDSFSFPMFWYGFLLLPRGLGWISNDFPSTVVFGFDQSKDPIDIHWLDWSHPTNQKIQYPFIGWLLLGWSNPTQYGHAWIYSVTTVWMLWKCYGNAMKYSEMLSKCLETQW